MGSLISPVVPFIDFNHKDLKQGTSAWASAMKQVCHGLEEYGCFVALYDGVPPELDGAILKATEELFALPTEIKSQNVVDKPQFGYAGQIPTIPLFEAMGIDNVTDPEEVGKFTELMWPDGNHRFREVAYSYSMKVAELDHMVVRMIFENYGLEKCYDSHVASTSYLLRILKYRAPETSDQGDNALPRHTDKTFLSILNQNRINGLEIKTKEGEWIGIDLPPNAFIVMAGDVSMAWSNDRIRACYHRVAMKASTTRYTLALFSFLSGMVQVPRELVDENHPLKYNPFDNVGLISFYVSEEGRKHEYTVKAYCGIETPVV
ncbi:2-oxoglutarate-dependent dioxygenase AOP3-like [Rhodamnia argentea]|uniref:2-oxoglutarate-dependent dioxygenase AOP3-like n=1 Tax=Rhodamnia argentea TaxID=178133 RepID=A0A8B8PAP9_9MYRT|nr:2-oxoglutarate-dependent dioxygenase AOP3-like [Rhodamnia argentea]